MIDSDGRRIAVYGLAVDDGSILLVEIAPPHPQAGAWTLPGGGSEWGESPEEALEREMIEETGLVPAIGRVVLVRSMVWHAGDEFDRPVHNLQLVYCVAVTGDPRPEHEGTTADARWIPLEGLGVIDVLPLVVESLACL